PHSHQNLCIYFRDRSALRQKLLMQLDPTRL
ncbi:unnamed protein product, partial [marine sediment metagenome]